MENVLRVEDGKYVTGEVVGAEVELMKLLWENPNPTAEFAAQTIALDLSGYDYVEVYYRGFYSVNTLSFLKTPIGSSGQMEFTMASSIAARGSYAQNRSYTTSTTGIVFDEGYQGYTGMAATVYNYCCIPVYIYGIKNKIQTIAKDVATTADKCIMSDGVTSVEDEITSISDKVYGRDYVEVTGNGSKNWTQLLNELFSLVDLNKVTCNSVFTMDFISYFHLAVDTGSALRFSYVEVGPSAVYILTTHLTESSSYYKYATNTSVTDKSAEVISNGMKLAVIY